MEQKLISTVEFQKKLNPKGYVLINYNGEYILEHRLIMQFYLGRELKQEEKVYHIDFNIKNNDINNLVCFPTNKSHARFHRQIKQFGYTNPRRLEILKLKQAMELERSKNIIEVII